jgi:splicing suppressor protein 51
VQAQREWARAIGQILSTRCALIATGFSPADVERDVLAFESVDGVRGEFDWLVTPGENPFASQQWAVADFDPRVAVKANWGIWAVRGKRYDIQGPTGY